jgi:hypothetical protein
VEYHVSNHLPSILELFLGVKLLIQAKDPKLYFQINKKTKTNIVEPPMGFDLPAHLRISLPPKEGHIS